MPPASSCCCGNHIFLFFFLPVEYVRVCVCWWVYLCVAVCVFPFSVPYYLPAKSVWSAIRERCHSLYCNLSLVSVSLICIKCKADVSNPHECKSSSLTLNCFVSSSGKKDYEYHIDVAITLHSDFRNMPVNNVYVYACGCSCVYLGRGEMGEKANLF